MQKIKPFGNNMLILPTEKKQALGQKPLCEYGTVLEIGSEVKNVKVGDTVGYLIWGVSSLEIEGKKHYFVPESSDFLLCTIEND